VLIQHAQLSNGADQVPGGRDQADMAGSSERRRSAGSTGSPAWSATSTVPSVQPYRVNVTGDDGFLTPGSASGRRS
jgi:hypothetical protein